MSTVDRAADVELSLDATFKALANPLRRHIVTTLLQTPGGQVESCAALNVTVSRSTLTQHMRVLHEAGLVETLDHGNRVFVRLRSAEIDQRFPGLLDLLRHES
ncbi:ArsR/SmtB family transcription factor [Kineococcus sp. NUM-3379]